MHYVVDVTRAILLALADVHPRGIHADALAAIVSCEQAALEGQLRLLSKTGAVCFGDAAVPVRISEQAMSMLRRSGLLRSH